MNLLVITPHLSTGGCPQYLLEYLKYNGFQYTNIKVIEFSNFSNEYVVQKNKIKSLIGSKNVICLGDFWVSDEQFKNDKLKLLDIISSYKPDVIWFNEFPECFEYKSPPKELMVQIYDKNRSYKIIETTHNNSFDFNCKIYLPDEFMFCSELHIEKSKDLNIKNIIWEIPIGNNIRPDRQIVLESLGLDSSYLHILNVGIINQNKNQKYIFELAEKLKFYKIKFHFIGNTCFLNDCGIPVDHLKQDNCIMWGERSDVDVFMSCMDLFLFPSHKELNPLSVKEALSWNMDVVCKKCDNYTYKYVDKSNFHLLENIKIKDYLINKLKNTTSAKQNKNKNKYKKFALYTSFYNCSDYVDGIFDQILNLKYNNFTWFITDDFSADDTKEKILNKLKNINSFKSIKYVDQDFKKQMYWNPNHFIDNSHDYIVTVDADDCFDLNFLNIYNKYLIADESIHLLSCDFQKINESNKNFHSFGLIKNDIPLKQKIQKFHPQVDYLNNLNYYCFGVLRCFKNSEKIKFNIRDYNACGEDSYRSMFMNSFGKWLHIPRNLYTWNFRENSESHSVKNDNFNNNFDIAYEAIINSESIVDNRFDIFYKETSALNYLNINFEKSISLFSKTRNTDKLKDLYFDLNMDFNDFSIHDFYVIVLNDFNRYEIKTILAKIKNKEASILFYNLVDGNYPSNSEMDIAIENKKNDNMNFLNSIIDVKSWFTYIRHFYLTCSLKSNFSLDLPVNDFIRVFNFDSENCKVDYALSNGSPGEYFIKILDEKTNMLLYCEKVKLNSGISYWTSFSFFKKIIYNSVLIVFEYEKTKVFEQSFLVNDEITSITKLFEKDYFKNPVEAYSYVEVFCQNQYSKNGISVEANDIVVDIGSNVGAFIKLALINNCQKIFSCEPNINCVSIINENYGKNKNLIINNCAIYDKNGDSYLDIDPQNNTSGSAKLIDSGACSYTYKNNIQIKTKTFKNFLSENSIYKIDFLKVDCEGGEDFIFIDENKQFIKENINKIVLETHSDSKFKIIEMLKDSDFEVIEEKINSSVSMLYAKKISKNCLINVVNESGSLGDAIAWIPIVNEFAKQNKQKINLFTPYKNLFEGQYELINFYDYKDKPNSSSEQIYYLGCFDDMNWKKYSLQEIACKILGINYVPIKPLINLPKSNKNINFKKYVCIATQSTSQCKYWNNKDGWNKTVDYLKLIGYDVICIDRYSIYGSQDKVNIIPKNCINDTGDKPLSDRIQTLIDCEFFIGLGSGLSWLAWACNKPVIMISGFSDPKSEFYTPYRVHNKNVCNSCWNDESVHFDRNDWLWCPRGKNFECSKEITFQMVKDKIDLCIKDNKNTNFNIKAAHILVDITSEREKKSIESMSIVQNDITYIQCINKKYAGEEWKKNVPINGWRNHGEGHYGAFQSFKKAILENFTEDTDALLLFEADCVLEVDKDFFLKNVRQAIIFCEKHDLPYFSFGPRVVNNHIESIELKKDFEYPDFIVTNNIIEAHCVLITKKYRNYIFDCLNNSWDSPDLWFNKIFEKYNMGITLNQLAYQTLGLSMIDNCIKGKIK
jgi:autotransporter strand-loop-strand O-heptosyltransferase